MNTKGFSLVELLVVVAIIGILASVGVVIYNNFIDRTRIVGTDATYNQSAKKIHTEYDAITGGLDAPSMFFDEEEDLNEVTCGEYMSEVKEYYRNANVANFFNSNQDLVLCADANVQKKDCAGDELHCPAQECSCSQCIDTVSELTVPLGSILLVCLDSEDKTFRESFGMQVILNNKE